jgi:hypothetical protein
MILLLGGLVYACLLGPPLHAQNAVANPYFSTMNMKHWTGDDPSLICVPGNINLGMDWYCLRKNPGSPDNNGTVTQDVHLIAGYTYQFSANIAAVYNCPG